MICFKFVRKEFNGGFCGEFWWFHFKFHGNLNFKERKKKITQFESHWKSRKIYSLMLMAQKIRLSSRIYCLSFGNYNAKAESPKPRFSKFNFERKWNLYYGNSKAFIVCTYIYPTTAWFIPLSLIWHWCRQGSCIYFTVENGINSVSYFEIHWGFPLDYVIGVLFPY